MLRIAIVVIGAVLALGTAVAVILSVNLKNDKARVLESNRITRTQLEAKKARDEKRYEWELEHEALPIDFPFNHKSVEFNDGYVLTCPVCKES